MHDQEAGFRRLKLAGILQAGLAALETAAADAGLPLKALDKKSEKALLTDSRAGLQSKLSGLGEPAVALSFIVPLLVMKVGAMSLSAFWSTISLFSTSSLQGTGKKPCSSVELQRDLNVCVRVGNLVKVEEMWLCCVQLQGQALSIPGKALAGVIELLKADLEPEAFQKLSEFHSLVVESLRSGGSTANPKLAELLPVVKGIAGVVDPTDAQET